MEADVSKEGLLSCLHFLLPQRLPLLDIFKMAKLEPFRGDYYLWKYLPSIPAAVVFLLLYICATLAFSWRIWRTKTWFCTAFAIGCLCQFIGYAARISSHHKTAKVMPFAIQNAFILIAPVFFAASIYMTLSRVIRSVGGERHALFKLRWLTRIFVTGDILALLIQSGAAGLMIVDSMASIGEIAIIGGLIFHIIIFGVFCVTATLFHAKMRRDPVAASIPKELKWEQILHMLYASSGLIMARSIFRMIEFIMGQDGYLLSTEWPLYVFDSVPMFAVAVIFWWRFPSTVQTPNASGEWEETRGGSMDSLAPTGQATPVKRGY
ncbi:RTA1 like protein-domain-containing protein [Chaetomium fimeti]|uniref:RTA1 like protein-domain-containing protein n=1 Tax=Chaetomium fimeti TaxID=1854472 RepID=A0AAE0HDZ4_9PEZI|nr:RTA1 like protein-domain-containing protein [Chaetomium fimeti]